MLQKSEFIMAFVVVKNFCSVLRGMAVKLKRDIDIAAYNIIEDTKKEITDFRANIDT